MPARDAPLPHQPQRVRRLLDLAAVAPVTLSKVDNCEFVGRRRRARVILDTPNDTAPGTESPKRIIGFGPIRPHYKGTRPGSGAGPAPVRGRDWQAPLIEYSEFPSSTLLNRNGGFEIALRLLIRSFWCRSVSDLSHGFIAARPE